MRRATRARSFVVALVGVVAALSLGARPAAAQAALDRPPNLDGMWVSEAGVLHFHTVHRFWLTERAAADAPRFLINHPTIQLAAGLGHGFLAGVKYVSRSHLGANEIEGYARWRPLSEAGSGLADVFVTGAWNGGAESVDAELALSRSLGPARVHAVVRGFSAFQGGDMAVAAGGGGSWRLTPNVAVAGDLVMPVTADTTPAWSVGLQLRIPYTPHTLSFHTTNAYATTLHGSAFGTGRLTYGFEFTVPLTLSRYFGGRSGSGGAATAPGAPGAPGAAAGAGDTAVVGMDNRLRFLPDTIRVRVRQPVRWENGSDVVHTVTADPVMAAVESSVSLPEGASAFDSGDIVPGASYTRVFTVPGTYTYFCIPHERLAMVGTVIVEER